MFHIGEFHAEHDIIYTVRKNEVKSVHTVRQRDLVNNMESNRHYKKNAVVMPYSCCITSALTRIT
jgi:hypothetical protein